MLLAIDVGNTETAIGLFDGGKGLTKHWRVSTRDNHTADEKIIEIADILAIDSFSSADITAIVLSSVVPACTRSYSEMGKRLLGEDPLIVGAHNISGLKIEYERPDEIGADRLVNSLAGLRLFESPLIIVDFGTATTFDIINEAGSYLGGIIAPGLEISAQALFKSAAKLSQVELVAPDNIIGTDTVSSIQSGLMYGTAAMVDGVIEKIVYATNTSYYVVATGGISNRVASHCRSVKKIEPLLTLLGLQMIYEDDQS